MIRAWRLVKARHAKDAFSGEGARLYGGRWNEKGTAVVYVGGSLALAALEQFVHLGPEHARLRFLAFPVDIPEDAVERADETALPSNWRAEPPAAETQALGTAWARAGRRAALRVPSVIVPVEHNYVLSPSHPGFGRIRIGAPQPFSFDPRMWKTARGA